MAQIIGANSLIYIEDGNFGAGWYIIPPGFDIENAPENGIAVEVKNGLLVHKFG